MTADLARHRQGLTKRASLDKPEAPPPPPTPIDLFKVCLEQHAGAANSLDKTASDQDFGHLYALHRAVETAYRGCVKVGKRPEANAMLEKFSGWSYLKGQPGEAGDMHPFVLPGEK